MQCDLLHRTGRALGRTAREVLRARTIRSARSATSVRGHTDLSSHGIVRRRGGGAVRGANTRVVLRSTPGEADARVPDGVPLHLIDGHLCSVAVNELDEAAALARRNLDVGDFAEALEERAKLVLSDVARQTADEDSGVVGVRELVHGLHWIELLLVVILRHRPATNGAGRAGKGSSHLGSGMTMSILVRTI